MNPWDEMMYLREQERAAVLAPDQRPRLLELENQFPACVYPSCACESRATSKCAGAKEPA